ncbi:MAG: 4Fe-4S binding protein [Desulfuromonadaceae bacterium]|nr:4Fe-4S binding protein [Desulfuromonadaceae bacterium]
MPLPRITRKRQFVQFLLLAAALLIPFVSFSGNPLLRMDIGKMTLFMAGVPLRIDQFYLVLLVTLLLVILFLLMTAVLGRVWCGWLCPQTVFNDMTELVTLLFNKRVPPYVARVVEHLTALIIAKLVAFNLFCWFMTPERVLTDLLHFSDHPAMLSVFLLLTVSGYLNLILVKRSFCRSYCPYGRFQTALMDAGTLNISFLEEVRGRCLRCNACVRTCPMGIDIREGFQIECIGCGRCIDACRGVMERKPDGFGLIDYRFGSEKGGGFRFGTTTIALLFATVLLVGVLTWGVAGRSQDAFAVQRVATAEPRRLPDGSLAQPWRAVIGNRTEAPRTYSIRVAGDAASGVELHGQTRDIEIAANQHREIIFMIHPLTTRQPGKFQLQLVSGDRIAATVTISP